MMPREQAAGLDDFRRLAASHLGLRLEGDRSEFLADLLQQRASNQRCASVADYLYLLRTPQAGAEWRVLSEHLTVCETYFFRHDEHLNVLKDVVLPQWLDTAPRAPLRVLSAGCASGEEPYSIAMLLEDRWAAHPALAEIRIQAVDLNPAVVEKARRGVYSPWSLRRTPHSVRERYFKAAASDFVLDPAIRERVHFEERNLALDDPLFWRENAFDVIFCRNVLMYFVPDALRAVVARLSQSLSTGGYLFLGHAETLRGISQDFHLHHSNEAFYYRKRCSADVEDFLPVGEPAAGHEEFIPLLPPSTASWYEIIQRSHSRIEALSAVPPAPADQPRQEDAVATAPVPLKGVANSELGSALEFLRQERFADAMDSLRALPSALQHNVDALLLRAVILTNSGKIQDAERVCRELLLADELNAGAQFLMSLCREQVGDRAAAREHAQAAIHLDPTFALPHFHLGLLARREGDLTVARQELSEALLLLEREDSARILLFGGGFSRATLVALCRSELEQVERSGHGA